MASIFLIHCFSNGVRHFCIYHSDDKDSLSCDENNRILCFSDRLRAVQYLADRHLSLDMEDDAEGYDFDALDRWVKSDDFTIDCYTILNFWNLFTDIAYSVRKKFSGDRKSELTNLIYKKLFFGNNLPAIKPSDEADYKPIWDSKQVATIKVIMKDGLDIWQKSVKFDPV